MPEQDLCSSLQQCQKRNARWPGTWHLAPRRAISLMPRKPSQILIVQGCAWITWDSRKSGLPAAGQDRFLTAGQMLDVPAGVRLVMESRDASQSVDFDWRVMPPEMLHRTPGVATALPTLWCHWTQSWWQLAQATGQLLKGLARHRWRSSQPVATPGSVA